MFTGLIQRVGEVVSAEKTERGVRLIVRAEPFGVTPAPGDSIAVNGVCLTVADSGGAASGEGGGDACDWSAGIAFDAVSETLRRSSLGGLGVGSRVNLEHAARADTLLGGHIVQGHVDAVGEVEAVQSDPEDWRVRIAVPAETMAAIAPKGSVTVEGVSLTVAESHASAFVIALIPATLEKTTLDTLKPGDRVNVETDIIARQVLHALRATGVVPG
jgi:riboflavin synthase